MSDLLPANATAQERAISDAIERAAAVPVVVRQVWNPDTCPSNLLAWLAWAFSADSWGISWSDEQRRGAIKASVAAHKYKGTIGAVREAMAGLFFDVQVQEWFNQIPAGSPYTFRILIGVSQVGASQTQMASLFDVVDSSKNLRSHLESVELIVSTPAGPYAAAATSIGNEITLTNYVPPV